MTKNRYPFVLCVVLLVGLMGTWAAQGVQAQASTGVVRVAPSGSNAAGCGSASKPCQTLQFAVEQLISGSGASRAVNGEVRIAAGTYTEGNPAFENIIGIGLPGNLTIRGGYTTANWNSSNPANATILDGQGSRRGILITVPEAQAGGCTMRVENLSIANGRASAADPSGGGILINNCKSVVVSNVTIRNSVAAGQSNTGNTALSAATGGGISVRGTAGTPAGLSLVNVTLSSNQALGGDEGNFARGGLGSGGGLYGYYSSVNASGLTVNSNMATAGDAPAGSGEDGVQRADGLGGGIGLIFSSFAFTNSTISQNQAQGGNAASKGGLGLGGGLFIELSSGSMNSVQVSSNQAKGANGRTLGGTALGGGIFLTDGTLTADALQVLQNSVSAGSGATGGDAAGGGISATTGQTTSNTLTLTNTIFGSNTATGSSGGIANGGGLQCADTKLSITNATFADNVVNGNGGNVGAAISLLGLTPSNGCSGTISNSIIANHAGSPVYVNANAGQTSFTTTLSDGNGAPFFDNAFARPVTESNTFPGNPNFVDAVTGDYRIGSGSAAIDTASGTSPATDIEGQPRPVGAASDVGADEYQVPFSAIAGNTSIALSWEAPPGTNVTDYEIHYVGEGGADDAAQGPSPINAGSSTSFNMTGLTKGAQYTITIVAFDGPTEVARSATISVRTGVYLVYLPLVVR